MTARVRTESLDYLQRCLAPAAGWIGPVTAGAPPTRRLVRVTGIGRPDKEPAPRRSEPAWQPPTAGLVTGLYGYRIPLAFLLHGTGDGTRVHLGTWAAREGAPADGQDRRRDVLLSVLAGLYPTVATEQVPAEQQGWPLAGLALGMPAPAGIDPADSAAPVDRIIRAMAGTNWAALVLAYPVAEQAISAVRAQVLNEIRAVETAVHGEGAPSPLAEQYVELLGGALGSLGEGMATGAWRTAAYLLGDGESYPRLAAVWRSVFSGRESLPEPVRILDRADAAPLARDWALPDAEGPPGPGHYRRPFEFQTLLTSAQLAAYAHLPELETPGFAIDAAPRFDSVPATAPRSGVRLGRVLHNRRPTGADYRVPLPALTRHVFVAGTTGSGKTNTIFGLLSEADAAGVPFLVIEPAKTEYRALLAHPVLGPRLRVFTAGKASVGPLLLNPFEVPAGVTVSEHLDLVRAAFAAAFGMWTPLPQILERCLHEVYAERGWDLRTNDNARGASVEAFPTLTDLVAKVAEVVPALGYEDRVTGDLRAALTSRLESLRVGGKGAMLDVARSFPVEDLLSAPTVIELEALGDEGDKAFLTALLLIRLAEYRRARGQTDRLVHLLVVEEAHRLLSAVPRASAEEADPRGQAVETFANLLSEVRAYGQSVLIADQVPSRLASDVVKNTTLKIAHRTVSADDRAVLGGAMAMEPDQTRALTTLAVGEAAVFGAGDDSPLLVRIPLAKDPMSPTPPADAVVAGHMRAVLDLGPLLLPRPFCAVSCTGGPRACEAARLLAADEYVQRTLARTILSTVESTGALDRLWEDLVGVLRARRPAGLPEADLLRSYAGHGADRLAARRGAQGVWSYVDTEAYRDAVQAVLLTRSAGAVAALRAIATRLQRREYEPYPACGVVCTQDPPQCAYRSAVADLVIGERYRGAWAAADQADAASTDGRRKRTWEVCQDAAYELVEFPDPAMPDADRTAVEAAARRVCLCVEQQMLAADTTKVPRTSRRILAKVLGEAGL